MWTWLTLALVARAAGWIVSAFVIWAAWTHGVSASPGWLLSTIIVAAATRSGSLRTLARASEPFPWWL